MAEQHLHNLFTELLGRYHNQLYAYIFAVVRDRADTDDIFQSVCLVLWRRFDSFCPDSNFFSWARQTAKLVICNFLRHQASKSRPTCASKELLDALAATVSQAGGDGSELYVAALRHCKGKLGASDEELLDLRYAENLGSLEIAERLQRSQQSICQSLKRIRRRLLECIQTELAKHDRSGGKELL